MTDRPLVAEGVTVQLHEGVYVIPDRRVGFVPNIGIVVGDDAVLVIDTAIGAVNGARVLAEARRLGGDRKLFLTTTHFHPEHAFGAQAFTPEATYIANTAQAEELADKGLRYVEMFSGFGPVLAELLADVELVQPEITYSGEKARVDLAGSPSSSCITAQRIPAATNWCSCRSSACSFRVTSSRTASCRSSPTTTPSAAAGSRCWTE